MNHTGPLGIHPSKTDKCAVKTERVDKEATQLKLTEWERLGKKGSKPKPVTKNVWACKRRMPQPTTDVPMIYKDPHKRSWSNLQQIVITG